MGMRHAGMYWRYFKCIGTWTGSRCGARWNVARGHGLLARGIASGSEADAVRGADALLDYLEALTRAVINS
jgi:hypothetical protein